MEATAPRSCTNAAYPRHNDRTLEEHRLLRCLHSPCAVCVAACPTQRANHAPRRHSKGTCGMAVERSACGRRTTQHIMHTMHLDGSGQLCSELICMPRQMTAPYNLATNSIARSKRNRAPILGPSQRCTLSPNNHDDTIINAPHRQHRAYRIQRGVPAARNAQRLHHTVRNTVHNLSQRATPSPDRAARAYQTPHNGLHDRALRDGCALATCNVQHAPMQHAARTDATCNVQSAPIQHERRTDATRIDGTC
jgi:hypothetical protein